MAIPSTVRSPAKINWTLRVIARRADGFHEIESLISPVSLFDELSLSDRADGQLRVSCDDPHVPKDESNLVHRAAMLLARAAGRDPGLDCHILKRIPVGGGLGGGSSNAAATLLELNRHWALHWPRDRLLPLAAELGSDAPFFLHGSSAVIRGRGEHVEPIRLSFSGWIVLVCPEISISTAAVYAAWQLGESDTNFLSVPSVPMDATEFMRQTFNMLEPPAAKVCPAIGDLLTRCRALAGRPVRLSGSGSTLFTAFEARAEAILFARRVEETLGLRTHLVQVVRAPKREAVRAGTR